MSEAARHSLAAGQARTAGAFYEAAQHQRRAVAVLREEEDARALAHALRHLAEILVQARAADDAADPVAEMLALYQSHPPEPLERANALRCAALQTAASGDGETAESFWIAALKGYEALGITAGVDEAQMRIAELRG